MKEKMLIVVSVLEGRSFPRRPGFQLVVEARLDGELMTTDEVDHIDCPDFNTELAWEVDQQSLRLFRMQRVPVKLQCFALNQKESSKELLGYIILDLRVAHPPPQKPKWYQLLSSKYRGTKPELKLALYIDKDKHGSPDLKTKSQTIKGVPRASTIIQNTTKLLKPMLNEREGYYQIGPANECTDLFNFSVTIVFAANTFQLTPSETPLIDDSKGFYFFYTLMDNDVTTDTFSDLISPSFPAEKATVRVRSSLNIIQQYFAYNSTLEVYLCNGDVSLGYAVIPLNSFDVEKLKTEKSSVLEDTYELHLLNDQVLEPDENSKPMVGISVQISYETQEKLETPKELVTPLATSEKITTTPPSQRKNLSKNMQSPPVRLPKTKEAAELPDVGLISSRSLLKDLSESKTDQHLMSLKHNVKDPVENSILQKTTEDKLNYRHYCFTLDIRYIKLFGITHPCQCFVRYSYPFFGTASAILTHPTVEVSRNAEVVLPNGYCAFNFAATLEQVVYSFSNLPLHLEVVNRNRQVSEDQVIGMASLKLEDVLHSGKARVKSETNMAGFRQTSQALVPVLSLNSKFSPIGEIQVVMSLDDFGVTTLPAYLVNSDPEEKEFSKKEKIIKSPSTNNKQESHDPAQQTIVSGTQSDINLKEAHKHIALQVAMELEQWKESQEKSYLKQLKEKEAKYLESLVGEWQKRDVERELVLQRKLAECKSLEDKLRLTLADVEQRERNLATNEAEFQHSKTEFEKERERHQQEVRDGYKRLKGDFEHCLGLERQKTLETEKQLAKLQKLHAELELKMEAKNKEFEIFREEQRNQPEIKLQAEINLLTLEKAEFERKLEAATKSKVHYKQQWGRCLRELARIKQKHEADARAHLFQQQQELENMRLQYLASTEENEGRQALQEINREFKRIKDEVKKTSENNENKSQNSPKKDSKVTGQVPNFSLEKESEILRYQNNHIARLMQERETLLQTGVYSPDDRLIVELDKQISEVKTGDLIS